MLKGKVSIKNKARKCTSKLGSPLPGALQVEIHFFFLSTALGCLARLCQTDLALAVALSSCI